MSTRKCMHIYLPSLTPVYLTVSVRPCVHCLQVLAKFGLSSLYEGAVDATGEDYNVEAAADGPRPFRAFLDVGLTRTTTGNRVFAALKGAVDGGIDVPHR